MVAGRDPAAGGRVPVDLDHHPGPSPQPARRWRDPGDGPTRAVARGPLGRPLHPGAVRTGSAGSLTTVDASLGALRRGREAVGALRLSGTQGTVTDISACRPPGPPFATFGGVVGIVLLLFVVAYAESLLRSLRRGRRRDNRSAAVVGLSWWVLAGG